MTFKVQVVGIDQTIRQVNDELRSTVKRLADDLFTEVVKTTPVKTGAARGGWKKTVNDRDFELSNDVPYVPVLDRGRHMTSRGMRGSKQAPNGIIGPSLKTIKGKN
jgi:uracil phosphoribosyltransferase